MKVIEIMIVADNVAKLAGSVFTVRPFIPKLLPTLIKIKSIVGDPEARSVVSHVVATLCQVGEVPVDSDRSDLPPTSMHKKARH